jgi:hypothetical protein
MVPYSYTVLNYVLRKHVIEFETYRCEDSTHFARTVGKDAMPVL